MKIIVFTNKEYEAILTDGHKSILINYSDNVKDIYNFAAWACETYSATIDILFM